MKIKILLLCSMFLVNTFLYSQDDSITSVDHSKITLSTDIIPAWKVQVEVGGSSWYSKSEKTYNPGTVSENTISYYNLRMNLPSLAFRVGVFRNVELRLGLVFMQEFNRTKLEGNIITFSSSRDNGIYGGGPIEAGVKYNFLERNKYLPEASVIVNLFIPAGDYYFHTDFVSPSFKLLLKKEISKNFTIGGNLGYGWNVYDRFTDKYGNYSIAIDAKISKRLNAFAEVYSYFQYRRTPDHRVGAGFTYQFSRNVMANIAGGIGLSERSPDLYGSGGIGFMFP
ncbi:MAG: transporter [Ignavibacteria bacterium]